MSNSNRNMRISTQYGDSLLLTRLQGKEAVSRLYRFDLAVQSSLAIPMNIFDLLGKDVRIDLELPPPEWAEPKIDGSIEADRSRRFCGLIEEASELHEDDHFRYFHLVMRPRLWLWTKSSTCRIFQEKTIPDILKNILQDLNVRYALRDDYRPRPYCVQYNESPFNFALRLMEEEGMFFFFEHSYEGQDDEKRQRGERLVVTDATEGLPFIESTSDPITQSINSENGLIRYESGDGGTRNELRVHKWHLSQRLTSTKSTVRDQAFQLPDQTLESKEEIPDQVEIGQRNFNLAPVPKTLDTFLYPGSYAKKFDGVDPTGVNRADVMRGVFQENLEEAKRRVNRHASRTIDACGGSNCIGMQTGNKFHLLKDDQALGPLILQEVTHTATLSADVRASDATEELKYDNEFRCTPSCLPFFPESISERPRIFGYQTAVVIAPSEQELHSDYFGRFKVRFNWDRTELDEEPKACWIRVAQVWAGNKWGAFFWPRAGHEVVVAFEHGDPDCPLIVGSVYNAKNMPPLTLPDRLHSSGVKSCSIGGNSMENYSCVIFHDGLDQEYLQLHSETHECLTSETAKLSSSTGPEVTLKGHTSGILNLFGSGSGGGPAVSSGGFPEGGSEVECVKNFRQTSPTSNSKHTIERERPKLPPVADSLNPDLRQTLEELLQVSSGSGGMISGVLMGAGAFPRRSGKGARAEEMTEVGNLEGGLELTTGKKIDIALGADIEHVFANKNEMFANVEGMMESILLSSVASLLPGGKLDWRKWGPSTLISQVFGNRSEITYGHLNEFHRGSETKVTAESFFENPSAVNGTTYATPYRTTTSNLVRIIAVIILLFDLAVAIALKVLMENPPAPEPNMDPDGSERKAQLQPWATTIKHLAYWSTFAESLLFKIEILIEQSYAELTEIEAKTGDITAEIQNVCILGARIATWEETKKAAVAKTEEIGDWCKENITLLEGLVFALAVIGIATTAIVEGPDDG